MKFGYPFEFGALKNLINATPKDAYDFFMFLDARTLLLAFAYLLPGILILTSVSRKPWKAHAGRRALAGIVLLAVLAPVTDYFHKVRYDVYSYVHLTRMLAYYSQRQLRISEAIANRLSMLEKRRRHLSGHDGHLPDGFDLIVVIIGESARKDHFTLYGYHRPTTPRLSARRNELTVFTNAISPANSSLASVSLMFTSLHGDELEKFPERLSIVGKARLAGYDTTWISNTDLLGRAASNFTIMAGEAHRIVTTRPEGQQDVFYRTDRAILPYLDAELERDPGHRKLIVLATQGSHYIYRTRYPDSFARFRPTLGGGRGYSPELRSLIVNAYDNTILFTDWFVEQVIRRLEQTGKSAIMFYFSDHAQRLYDDGRTIGHGFNPATPGSVPRVACPARRLPAGEISRRNPQCPHQSPVLSRNLRLRHLHLPLPARDALFSRGSGGPAAGRLRKTPREMTGRPIPPCAGCAERFSPFLSLLRGEPSPFDTPQTIR